MAQSQRKKDQFITKQDKKLLLNDNQSLEDQTDIKKIQPKTEDPYAEITEQPAFENVRFHSDSDGQKPTTSIPGANSSAEKRTYPTLAIRNFEGDAVVVVSCVSAEEPFRAHPHKLVWREGKTEKGVCSANIRRKDMICELRGLTIEYVKKANVKASLEERRQIRVDPFKQGFEHMNMDINLSAVRLCFQVFLKLKDGSLKPLRPIVTNVIKDKKRSGSVQILEISDTQIPLEGNKKILFFCDRMQKSDMELKLVEKNAKGVDVWTHFVPHSQMKPSRFGGVSFIAPPYKESTATQPIKVQLILTRLSDQKSSEPVHLIYVPKVRMTLDDLDENPEGLDIPRVSSTFSIMNMPNGSGTLLEDFQTDQRLMSLKSNLNTLTKVLEAEKEANRLLTQRSTSLQTELDTAKTDLKVLELELKATKEEKGRLWDKNETLLGQVRALELKCMELEHSRAFGSNESFLAALSQERETNNKLVDSNQKIGIQMAEMRFQMKEQEVGVQNMRWQLELKASQIQALESRLQATFPNVPLLNEEEDDQDDQPLQKKRKTSTG